MFLSRNGMNYFEGFMCFVNTGCLPTCLRNYTSRAPGHRLQILISETYKSSLLWFEKISSGGTTEPQHAANHDQEEKKYTHTHTAEGWTQELSLCCLLPMSKRGVKSFSLEKIILCCYCLNQSRFPPVHVTQAHPLGFVFTAQFKWRIFVVKGQMCAK